MASFQISDAEWSVLAEEPADVFKLYCVIRRHMDYSTGVAGGQKRRFSEQGFKESLYIAPLRGRKKSGSPTRQKVRSLIDRLIKIGAVLLVGPLVFQLPYADRDGTSKPSATNQQPKQQPLQNTNKFSQQATEYGACSKSEKPSKNPSEKADCSNSNLPPLSALPISYSSAETLQLQVFTMAKAWLPDPVSWPGVLAVNGLKTADFTGQRLRSFRSYWMARKDKQQTQAQWEHQLAQTLVLNVEHAAKLEQAKRARQGDQLQLRLPRKVAMGLVPKTPHRASSEGGMSDIAAMAIARGEAEAAEIREVQGISSDRDDLRKQLRTRLNIRRSS
jgi:hypothetical protein